MPTDLHALDKLIFLGSQYLLAQQEREIKLELSRQNQDQQASSGLVIERRRDHKLLSREQLIARLPRVMARVFWRANGGVPFSREEVSEALSNPSDKLARHIPWFHEIHGSMAALMDMTQELAWIELDPGDRSTWPEDKEKVYYFFEVVGTHPGEFSGPLSPEQIQAQIQANPRIRDVFEYDPTAGASFGGKSGFLDMYDVSHWARRPIKSV